MRGLAWTLLLLVAFVVPWEYSLDFGAPLGNIARLAALALLLVVVPMVALAGRGRAPGPLQWLVLALFVWICCSVFWTIDSPATLHQVRGYFQEFMIVWLVWELIDTPSQWRDAVRAYVAGAWVLAALTIASFAFGSSPGQVRFVAEGQDPNDVARCLVLALPLAALLAGTESRATGKLLAGSYMPAGLLAILLTASRSGFLAGVVALGGCGLLLWRANRRSAVVGQFALPALVAGLWITVPQQTLERLASIPQQLEGGDLNQRWNIWSAGWEAFVRAPFLGSGAGTFVTAAGLAPIDTAHNTALALMVEGGIVALFLGMAIVVASAMCVLRTRGPLRIALGTVLVAWMVSSLVATVQENRATWLLVGLMAVAARLTADGRLSLAEAFPASGDFAAIAYRGVEV
jgi:O-antigen ligase